MEDVIKVSRFVKSRLRRVESVAEERLCLLTALPDPAAGEILQAAGGEGEGRKLVALE